MKFVKIFPSKKPAIRYVATDCSCIFVHYMCYVWLAATQVHSANLATYITQFCNKLVSLQL